MVERAFQAEATAEEGRKIHQSLMMVQILSSEMEGREDKTVSQNLAHGPLLHDLCRTAFI